MEGEWSRYREILSQVFVRENREILKKKAAIQSQRSNSYLSGKWGGGRRTEANNFSFPPKFGWPLGEILGFLKE